MKVIKLGLKYAKVKNKLVLYVLGNVVYSILMLIIPYLTSLIIDIIVYTSDFDMLVGYCIYIAIIYLLRLLLSYFIKLLYAEIHITASYNMSRDFICHIHNCPVLKTDKMDPAYLNQRISQDAGAVLAFSIFSVVNILKSSIEFLVAMVIVFIISPIIAAASIALLGIYIIVYQLLKKPLYERNVLNREEQALYFSKMQEQLQYTKFIKIHSLKSFFLDRLHLAFSSFRHSFVKYQRTSILFYSLDGVVTVVSQILLYIAGGFLVILGSMTIGSFILVGLFFSKMLGAAGYFFSLSASYQDALVSYNRMMDILSWEVEKNGNAIPKIIANITLEDISFCYDDKQVLNDFCYNFERGKMYGLVGENGCGKSTLSKIILGLYKDEYKGKVTVNGKDISELDLHLLRKDKISYVEQESVLFTDTLEKNIFLWRDGNTNPHAEGVLDSLLSFVTGMPNNWRSMVAPKNNNLSGGEKQRIALARALSRDSDVCIFDEPTSALDKEVVDNLIQYFCRIKVSKIVIIASHDKRVLNVCDEIVML